MRTTAGSLIREARRTAGWTLRQLSDRSGVAVSTLRAYENGRRDPGTEALATVLRAMGRELATTPRSEQSRHVELVMELADHLPQRHAGQMAFPPFATFVRR